jgi:hypothetical protein
MKFETQSYGDYNKRPYEVGKHEFIAVPSAQFLEVNGNKISFQAENVYINGMEISNNTFQQLMNIYAGRQKKSKKLTKRVNEIKANNPTKCVYDTCNQAEREIRI